MKSYFFKDLLAVYLNRIHDSVWKSEVSHALDIASESIIVRCHDKNSPGRRKPSPVNQNRLS